MEADAQGGRETGAGVSILVACRNEEAGIAACIRETLRVMPEAEILVVDGGTDRTMEIAGEIARAHPNVRPLRNPGDRGKGHAIRFGNARATAPIIAQFDADLQFFADDLPALVAPLRRGECDLVCGSRFLRGADRAAYRALWQRDLGNQALAACVSMLAGRRVTDVTTGLKAWTREAMRRIAFRDDRYSYEAEIVVRAARLGLRMREIPVRYASRVSGESMHRNAAALLRAGLTILAKSVAARFD